MAKAREIRKRIKAVANIRRITKTMQMIATSKFAKAQQRATASKPFTEGIFQLVTELAAKAGNVSHPLINGPTGGPKGKPLVLVVTSDRGLCGPYNGLVLRLGAKHIREVRAAGQEVEIELSGRKGVAFCRFNKIEVGRMHNEFGDNPKYDAAERLAQDYMDRFLSGRNSSISIISMKFLSAGKQRPEVLQLLPLKPPTAGSGGAPSSEKGASRDGGKDGRQHRVDYEFSPSPEELLGELLPATVKATLFQCLLDAAVSEHVARMVAMKAATDNAAKMGKLLNRKFNRARQAQITTELTEIVSGAAALE